MEMAMGAPAEWTISYQIDQEGRIISVSDAWGDFARANDGGAVMPEKVLGRPLWQFIEDDSVRQIYRHLVNRARSGRPVEFRYRCDSPTQRRVFRMRIALAEAGRIGFYSRLVAAEARAPAPLLAAGAPRTTAIVRVCSWCQRIAMGADDWVEVEVAVDRLQLLQADTLPALTHGICPSCLDAMQRLLTGSPPGQDGTPA